MLATVLLSGWVALAWGPAAPSEQGASRIDALGDPLPPGALLRLGTTRLHHDSWVMALAFSPDGKVLASASDDKTVHLWDPATGKELRRMTADHEVMHLAFAPDGKSLAVSTNSGMEVLHWQPTTGKEVRRFRAHAPLVERSDFSSLAFSPGGKVLAWGGRDGTLHFWDVASSKEIGNATLGRQSWILTVAFSPDGKLVAVGGYGPTGGGAIQLREVSSGKEVRSFPGQAEPVHAVAFAPDGKRFASAGQSHDIHLWDPATGKEVRRLRGTQWGIWSLAFSPDGKTLASADCSGTRTWDVATSKEILALSCGRRVAFSPDGKTLVGVGELRYDRADLGRGRQGAGAVGEGPDDRGAGSAVAGPRRGRRARGLAGHPEPGRGAGEDRGLVEEPVGAG